MNEEVAQNLSTLLKTFNDNRVISEGEIKKVLSAIVAILAENKKSTEELNEETKHIVNQTFVDLSAENQIKAKEVLKSLAEDYEKYSQALQEAITLDSALTRKEIEKATKEQNDRAFKRLKFSIVKPKLLIFHISLS